jgi:hypothetical protein
MATSNREEARQRRAEARRSRRDGGSDTADEREQPERGDDSLETVKQAAKAAAAAAALGAAVGAARALRGGEDEDAAQAREPDEPERDDEQAADAREEPEPEANELRSEAEPEREDAAEDDEREVDRQGASPGEAKGVVEAAREQLSTLLGTDADRVSGLERSDGGWVVCLEVVELARIPESTDVMGSYELTLDEDRKLVRYRRGRRYYRAQADADQGP